jgi:uncharacterized protein (DUF362 family)
MMSAASVMAAAPVTGLALPGDVLKAARPRVAIAKAATYDPKLVRQQMETLLDSLGGLGDVIHRGDRVAIKVNLTGGTASGKLPGISPIESFVTHPQVVQALGELVRDAGAKELYIVEAIYDINSYVSWGYVEAAKAVNAVLIDLNSPAPYEHFSYTRVGENWLIYPYFTFNYLLENVDAFISVGKMKCHWSCGVTHAMKNLVGLVPWAHYTLRPEITNRSSFHGLGDEFKTRLPRIVVDLNRARPIHLALIDAIKTVDGGEGPWHKLAPQEPGILIAGKNALATDAIATTVMGFDPTVEAPNSPFLQADNYLNLAAQAGLGTNRPDEIEVVGVPVNEVLQHFAPSEE